MTAHHLNIHSILTRTRANGPGLRTAIWLQGCNLGCPGCFNPETHTVDIKQLHTALELAELIVATPDIEGLTISGGEPMQQAAPVAALLRQVRAKSQLSTLMFSGYTIDEIRERDHGNEVLSVLDILIDGRYDPSQRLARGLQGSANQTIHILTDRYTMEDVQSTPEAEITIDSSGNAVVTGVAPIKIR